jgi:GcrA cell cycle regulator
VEHTDAESDMSEWPDYDLLKLRQLWEAGMSTAAIGLQMSRTKNAIVGKSHRLGLPQRADPIIRDGRTPAPDLRHTRRVAPVPAAQTPPPLPSIAAIPLPEVIMVKNPTPDVVPAPMQRGPVHRPLIDWTKLASPVPSRFAPTPHAHGVVPKLAADMPMTGKCRWPMWGDGKPSHIYCDKPCPLDKSWCAIHAKIVLVRVRDYRREDAA